MNSQILTERREVKSSLQDTVDEELPIDTIPLALAHAVRLSTLTGDQKRSAFDTIRAWTEYARHNGVSDDPFGTRFHVAQFAAQEFGNPLQPEKLQEVDISLLSHEGMSLSDIIAAHTSPEILYDKDVAIVGGAARTALKLYAGVEVAAELPISDIDAVLTAQMDDVGAKAALYGVDLAGAKIVDGNVRDALEKLTSNHDCTMNQVAIHDGKLLFADSALRDIQSGAIRMIGKNDPLFGSEGAIMPDGNVYLNRTGFYRGLSFLLRKKGEHLVVSKENLEREKDAIGRYWQIMLFMKLLPIQDETARHDAIGNWHEIAQRIGSTQTDNPLAFLEELSEAYPDTDAGKKRAYDPNRQARWIIKRLIGEGVEQLYGKNTTELPDTYTEANLSLAESFPEYDYEAFMRHVQTLGR